jgi:hypothetical protein
MGNETTTTTQSLEYLNYIYLTTKKQINYEKHTHITNRQIK